MLDLKIDVPTTWGATVDTAASTNPNAANLKALSSKVSGPQLGSAASFTGQSSHPQINLAAFNRNTVRSYVLGR